MSYYVKNMEKLLGNFIKTAKMGEEVQVNSIRECGHGTAGRKTAAAGQFFLFSDLTIKKMMINYLLKCTKYALI